MYQALEATLHDAFWEAEGESAELPLLESFLQNHAGTALELGCGSGRLLLPLLEKGFLVEGLDNSGDMLALCAERCAAHQPVLHHADMLDFSTGSTYSAITAPAFTLQFCTPEKLHELLSNIHQHLHPGGGLYLTIFIPWAEIIGELEEDTWFLDQQIAHTSGKTASCHTRFQVKRLSQQLIRNHRYELTSSDGEVQEKSTSTHYLTWFWLREIKEQLERADFNIDQVIGDFEPDEACSENSQILTVLAHRN